MSKFHYFNRVTSTNQTAYQLGITGEPSGTFALANRQTRGKGRGEHGWDSPEGGIYLSGLFRGKLEPDRLNGFQLLTALAGIKTIRELSDLNAQIRLPNDLYLNQKKIGGVLLESRLKGDKLDFLVAGIGINLNTRAEDLQPSTARTATSLRMECSREFSKGQAISRLIEKLLDYWESFAAQGLSPFIQELEEHCDTLGRKVIFNSEDGEMSGILSRITPRGTFLLERPNGVNREILHITGLKFSPLN